MSRSSAKAISDKTIHRGRGVTALLLWCDHQEGRMGVSPGLDKLDIREAGSYIRVLEDELSSRGVMIEKASLGMFEA